MKYFFSFLILLFSLQLSSAHNKKEGYDGKHEWRAVWIATVNNIDWPSKPGLDSETQKKELIEYLDLFKEFNFNAVILQVRPTADALYVSENEPWSIYLTGDQNLTPDPLYDPLQFAIEQAHKRGMELHAWLNPYRVCQDTADIRLMNPDHLYFKRPELFVRHGKKLYFDPAYPETRESLVNVVKDMVNRYDLDGIHFDDYFYPNNDFVDDESFKKHPRGYSAENKMAWRRENVDLVIEMLRDTIKSIKPYIKFGISPYAVWRNLREDPRGSDTKSYGYTNYDHLHADLLLWMEKGWLDYVLPQLYFNIGYENADFKIVSEWWRDYSAGTPVYGGLGTYRLSANAKIEAWRDVNEIGRQVKMLRDMDEYGGVCYFNAKNMKQNILGINELLRELYPNPAIIPPMRGFSSIKPETPQNAKVIKMGTYAHIVWERDNRSYDTEEAKTKYHLVYKFKKGKRPDFSDGKAIIALTGEGFVAIPAEEVESHDYYISSLNRLFTESDPVRVEK